MRSDGGKWTKGIVDGIPQINTLNHISFTQVNFILAIANMHQKSLEFN